MLASSKDHPILSVVVTSSSPECAEGLEGALSRLSRFDPSVRIRNGDKAGQYVLEGWRSAQLEVICDRVREEYQIDTEISEPTAICLVTIRGAAVGEGKYIRQIGGQGNYGHCRIRVEPNERGNGYEFFNELPAEQLPLRYGDSIEGGVRKCILDEKRHGHPLVDLKVTLVGGSFHETDSNALAFEFASATALKRAMDAAEKIVLEPMMTVKVEVPELADIDAAIVRQISELRGRMTRSKAENGWCQMEAIVPLSELLASGSLTLGAFPMEFAGFEQRRDDGEPDENGTRVPVRPSTPQSGTVSNEPPND